MHYHRFGRYAFAPPRDFSKRQSSPDARQLRKLKIRMSASGVCARREQQSDSNGEFVFGIGGEKMGIPPDARLNLAHNSRDYWRLPVSRFTALQDPSEYDGTRNPLLQRCSFIKAYCGDSAVGSKLAENGVPPSWKGHPTPVRS